MDPENFEQISVLESIIGDAVPYLLENMEVQLSTHNGTPIAIELPARVTLEVKETEPVTKGQTASGSFKPAILSNGVRTMVPTHIVPGVRVVVLTRKRILCGTRQGLNGANLHIHEIKNPDIWAGIAIGAVAALFALPGRLKRIDIAALAAMTAFAALAHSSVAPVLLALMLAGGGWRLIARGAPDPRLGLAVCALSLAAAVAGGFAFTRMVERTAGLPPVTPPFLSARVVADGTGTRFARERCAGAFVVCRFADRFPMDVDDFLWAPGRAGVFESASSADRRALGAEQARFALAAARAYPLQQALASARNAALQVVDIELSDFNYKPSLRASLTARTPPATAAVIRRSLAYREAWPLGPLWALQAAATLAALAAAGWLASRPRFGIANPDAARAGLLFALIVIGVLANGVVCGVLSTLYGRYEARVVWTLPLAACALALAATTRRPPKLQLVRG